MVVEHFRNKDPVLVYRRFRDRGRMAPEGLLYVSSWVDEKLERYYQLMETDDRRLLDQWMANWNDLIDFEVHPVITSKQATDKLAAASIGQVGRTPSSARAWSRSCSSYDVSSASFFYQTLGLWISRPAWVRTVEGNWRAASTVSLMWRTKLATAARWGGHAPSGQSTPTGFPISWRTILIGSTKSVSLEITTATPNALRAPTQIRWDAGLTSEPFSSVL